MILFYMHKIWIIFFFFYPSLRLLQKVTKVPTGRQKWPKMDQNSIISSFFLLKGQKKTSAQGRNPPQELEVGRIAAVSSSID